MDITHQIEAENLSPDFVEYVKRLFKGKRIRVTVEEEMDDTTYLMADPVNHARLMESMENIRKGEGLTAFNPDEFRPA